MQKQKYSVNQHLTETILSWVKSGEIAIPEIQRPFVWNNSNVRDLMDSLYQGYPIGYLIVWRNPDVRLKDGRTSGGKKILIDGQQRVIALKAAILGDYIIDKDYRKIRIKIAFNPIEEKFEVLNPAIAKDSKWIPDISTVVSGETNILELVDTYCEKNKEIDRNTFYKKIETLTQITKKQIGVIELEHDLDIEEVTEIFIRINSQGVMLNQADFAMSKIAASEQYGGSDIRKSIDYFCHLAVAPEFYSSIIEVDKKFTETEYFQKMSWLKKEMDDLYDPDYTDLLRVAFAVEFDRGRLADLVSLLSGRNFETREYEEEIAQDSFKKLEGGIFHFINETNFKKFLMIIRSAGFIDSSLLRSKNVTNFAYALYLKLRSQGIYPSHEIEKYVRRWLVLSILTGRYSASPESQFDYDIKQIAKRPFAEFLNDIELAELSDAFWDASLVQSFTSPVASSPYINVFWASQVKTNDNGFLSRDIKVHDLITHKGDVHHIFPKEYLKSCGMKKNQYNQIANYVYMQSEINVKIGDHSPKEYFTELIHQCNGGPAKYGGINDIECLKQNLNDNCIPATIFDMTVENYDTFLDQRRILIAKKIRDYYFSL